MNNNRKNLNVTILGAEGFEQQELTEPRKALDEAGTATKIISPEGSEVWGWNHYDKGDLFKVDLSLADAKADDFDSLLLPGGVANPDELRMKSEAVKFVRDFFTAGKQVAAICHGP